MTRRSSLFDQPNSFGWISIALHWSTALGIIGLWFIGTSISFQLPELMDDRRSLHITLGLIFWLPLAGRIAWRLLVPHPHVPGQSLRTHQVARALHYVLLAVLVVMLVSGPMLAWLLPEQMPERTGIVDPLLFLHGTAANILAILVALHILAALKHLMFHDDETIARIFTPRKG